MSIRSPVTSVAVFLTVVFVVSLLCSAAKAQQPGLPDAPKPKDHTTQPAASESGWPRTFTSGVNPTLTTGCSFCRFSAVSYR